MAIFNSYVKLPEGISDDKYIVFLTYTTTTYPSYTQHIFCANLRHLGSMFSAGRLVSERGNSACGPIRCQGKANGTTAIVVHSG